jgi:ligand-binding SRPBCC domain-containing protein
MPQTYTIRETILIHAPIERVFALSTSLELVGETLGMKTVADSTPNYIARGHVVANSRVHWQGWKFGLPTHHHTLISGFETPHEESDGACAAWFQDRQARGRFASFQHDHRFREEVDAVTQEPSTTLSDEVTFALPFGLPGSMVARIIVAPYIRKLCRQRFSLLKTVAESEAWHAFVDPAQL